MDNCPPDADPDEGLPPFAVGAIYKSFKDIQRAIAIYEEKKKVLYVRKHGHYVETFNANRKPTETAYREELIYTGFTYQCKQFGQVRSDGAGIRPRQTSLKRGCRSQAKIGTTRGPNGVLRVISFHEEHVEHEVSAEVYETLPGVRNKMTSSTKDAISIALDVNIPAAGVAEFLREYDGIKVTAKDIQNLKYHGPKEDVELLSTMRAILARDEKAVFLNTLNKEGKVNFVFFQSGEMKRNLGKFPEIIGMDTTYNVNHRKMHLNTMMVVDGEGRGRVVAHALISDELGDTYLKLVTVFRKMNPQESKSIQVFITDKDTCETNAIQAVFPGVPRHLCVFHVMSAIVKKLKTYHLPKDELEELTNLVRAVVLAKKEFLYKDAKNELFQSANEDFIKYFNKNWHGIPERWSEWQRAGVPTFGTTTTNHLESFHAKIKNSSVVDPSYPLHTCVRKLHNYTEKVSRDKREQNAQARAKVHYNINDRCPIVKSINHVVERQTAGKMLEQLKNVKTKKKYYKVLGSEGDVHRVQSYGTPHTVTLTDTDYHCTCTLHNKHLLPCYHMYFVLLEYNMELLPAWISNRFHRSQKTTLPFKNVPESYEARFELLAKYTKEIISTIAASSQEGFINKTTLLHRLYTAWTNDWRAIVVVPEMGDHPPTASEGKKKGTKRKSDGETAEANMRKKSAGNGNRTKFSPTENYRAASPSQANTYKKSAPNGNSYNDNNITEKTDQACTKEEQATNPPPGHPLHKTTTSRKGANNTKTNLHRTPPPPLHKVNLSTKDPQMEENAQDSSIHSPPPPPPGRAAPPKHPSPKNGASTPKPQYASSLPKSPSTSPPRRKTSSPLTMGQSKGSTDPITEQPSISAVEVELFGSDCSPVNYMASEVNSPQSLNCHRDSSLSYHYVPPDSENITPPQEDQPPSYNLDTDMYTAHQPPLLPTQSVEPSPFLQPQPPTALPTPNVQQSVCSTSPTPPMPNKMKQFYKPQFKVRKNKAPSPKQIGSIQHGPKVVEPEPLNNQTSPLPKVASPVPSNNENKEPEPLNNQTSQLPKVASLVPSNNENKELEINKDISLASSVLTPWGERSSLLDGLNLNDSTVPAETPEHSPTNIPQSPTSPGPDKSWEPNFHTPNRPIPPDERLIFTDHNLNRLPNTTKMVLPPKFVRPPKKRGRPRTKVAQQKRQDQEREAKEDCSLDVSSDVELPHPMPEERAKRTPRSASKDSTTKFPPKKRKTPSQRGSQPKTSTSSKKKRATSSKKKTSKKDETPSKRGRPPKASTSSKKKNAPSGHKQTPNKDGTGETAGGRDEPGPETPGVDPIGEYLATIPLDDLKVILHSVRYVKLTNERRAGHQLPCYVLSQEMTNKPLQRTFGQRLLLICQEDFALMDKQKQEQISNVAGLVLAYAYVALLTWREVLPKVLDVPHDPDINLHTKRWPRIDKATSVFRLADQTITARDFNVLASRKQWMTDTHILGYFRFLERRINTQTPRTVFIVPSFWPLKWNAGHFGRQWLLRQYDLRVYKWLFVPICNDNHWFMLVVDIQRGHIYYLDSIQDADREKTWVNVFRAFWAHREIYLKQAGTRWTYSRMAVTQQRDGHSCGVFVMMNGAAILNDIPLTSVQEAHLPFFKKYVACCLDEEMQPNNNVCCSIQYCLLYENADGAKHVNCANCNRRYHLLCLDLEQAPPDYTCHHCN